MLVGTVYLFASCPRASFPSEDTGQLSGQTEAAQGIGFEAMVAHQSEVVAIMRRTIRTSPAFRRTSAAVADGGRLNIDLKPRDERQLSADQVIDSCGRSSRSVPGVRVFLQNPPAIRIGGMHGASQYQFTLQGADTTSSIASRRALEAQLRELPGSLDVTSDLQIRNPQVDVELDRDASPRSG